MEFASQYEARPIRRASQRYFEDTMSEAIMKHFIKEGDEVSILMANPKKVKGIEVLTEG